MASHITHRYGSMEVLKSVAELPALLRELDERPGDTEHGSVAVSNEAEWCISVSRGGYVIFEHLENGGERHMNGVSDARILRLWEKLVRNDIAGLEQESWEPGY